MPLRIELGPRDVAQGKFVVVRRDTGEKMSLDRSRAVEMCQDVLDKIQENLFNK